MNFSINRWTIGELSKGPSRRVRPEPVNTNKRNISRCVKAKVNERVWQDFSSSSNDHHKRTVIQAECIGKPWIRLCAKRAKALVQIWAGSIPKTLHENWWERKRVGQKRTRIWTLVNSCWLLCSCVNLSDDCSNKQFSTYSSTHSENISTACHVAG